jgi:hypothetical protein
VMMDEASQCPEFHGWAVINKHVKRLVVAGDYLLS